ncbi:HNH endonuclease [Filimonas effusa]|uniref:HNH endonuclease n=1 Tax=Filimonas effusa TaxID=2508721 RepID=A0A4Q1DC67_9BACT|nr:HNH endonuclease [Filimonas effusa]RXK87047.1 HNH endonuclease [Filimonas effusa]
MSKLIEQPCANKLAYAHFWDTIKNSVKLSRINKFLTREQQTELKKIYPDGHFFVWGVEPKKGPNIREWEKITPGDLAVFAKDKFLICSGIVTYKMQNASLARYLWGSNGPESTWEYIYFLKDINDLSIPLAEYNLAADHKPNYLIQGFRVLDILTSQKALEELSFDKEIIKPNKPGGKRKAALDKLKETSETDKQTTRTYRLEQSLLADVLHDGKKINTCAICNKRFPVSFLVTAHIKIRVYCGLKERIDPNIVMPLCKMGCDELYERGYICIVNGYVKRTNSKPASTAISSYIRKIVRNKCGSYNEHSSGYFQWHYEHHTIEKHKKPKKR